MLICKGCNQDINKSESDCSHLIPEPSNNLYRGVGENPQRRRSPGTRLVSEIMDQAVEDWNVSNPPHMQTQKPLMKKHPGEILLMEVSKVWVLTAPLFGFALGWMVSQ